MACGLTCHPGPDLVLLGNKAGYVRTQKGLVGKLVIKELFRKTPEEGGCGQPNSQEEATSPLGRRAGGQEGTGTTSESVSFSVEGVQCEEVLRLLVHRTVACGGGGRREAGALRL